MAASFRILLLNETDPGLVGFEMFQRPFQKSKGRPSNLAGRDRTRLYLLVENSNEGVT